MRAVSFLVRQLDLKESDACQSNPSTFFKLAQVGIT